MDHVLGRAGATYSVAEELGDDVDNMETRALARDPSTRHLDGLFHLWTGKKEEDFFLFLFKAFFCKF